MDAASGGDAAPVVDVDAFSPALTEPTVSDGNSVQSAARSAENVVKPAVAKEKTSGGSINRQVSLISTCDHAFVHRHRTHPRAMPILSLRFFLDNLFCAFWIVIAPRPVFTNIVPSKDIPSIIG